MGFKSLFKVRKPGHGEQFEKRVKSAMAKKSAEKFPSHDNSQNSGEKKGI